MPILSMLQALACAGYGIAYLPAYSLREDLNQGSLVPLLEAYLLDAVPISVVYPNRQLLGKAKRLFIDHLIAYAEQHPFSDAG